MQTEENETPRTAPCPGRMALRGALGFGLGSLLAFAPVYLPLTGGLGQFVRLLIAYPLSGAVGGALLAGGLQGKPGKADAALGFGIGFLLAGAVMPAALLNPQDVVARPLYQAGVFAVGLGAAGALGAMCFGWRACVAAASAFAISGVAGGPIAGSRFLGTPTILLGLFVSYALGGALLGAALACLPRPSGDGD